MKRLFIAAILFVSLFVSCSKNDVPSFTPFPPSILGVWMLKERMLAIDVAPTGFKPVTPAGQTIEFKADGSFTGTTTENYKNVIRYSVESDRQVRLFTTTYPEGSLYEYILKPTGEFYLIPLSSFYSEKFSR